MLNVDRDPTYFPVLDRGSKGLSCLLGPRLWNTVESHRGVKSRYTMLFLNGERQLIPLKKCSIGYEMRVPQLGAGRVDCHEHWPNPGMRVSGTD